MISDDRKLVFLSLTQPPIPIIKDAENEMDVVIECPYCGHITKVGDTFMISGFVGCDHCYFAPGGLQETVMYVKKNDKSNYISGKFYDEGFEHNRNKKKGKEL